MHFQQAKKKFIKSGLALALAGSLLMPATMAQASEEIVSPEVVDYQLTAGAVNTLAGVEEKTIETAQLTAGAISPMSQLEGSYDTIIENVETRINESGEWATKLMPNTDEQGISTDVYVSPSTEESQAGKLRTGDVAEIKEVEQGWYKISSGNLEGYVPAEDCVVGLDAKELSQKVCKSYAVSTANRLRVRTGPSKQTKVLRYIDREDTMEIMNMPDLQEDLDSKENPDNKIEKAETEENLDNKTEKAETEEKAETDSKNEEWVSVSFADREAFLSMDYVTIETQYGSGITMEEAELYGEDAVIEADEEEDSSEAAAEEVSEESENTETVVVVEDIVNPTPAPAVIQNESVAASVDDVTLLAALIQCEAGGCPYEGMLAVGGVVMNRMRAGYADGTLRGVIYQPHQFTPAGKGLIEQKIANGVNPACIQAAQEALAGVDITGGCLNFRAAYTGHPGNNIGGNVFF